jgi:hypothetical protein
MSELLTPCVAQFLPAGRSLDRSLRTPDVAPAMTWRRHSCLRGRDSDLLRSWNWVEPGGGARLKSAPEGTPDFSPPAAGLTWFAGGRAEARRRLKSAPPSKRSLTLFPRANRNCGRHQEFRDSSRRSGTPTAAREEGRDESRPGRQECLRHITSEVGSAGAS